jgi:hypothetical protein
MPTAVWHHLGSVEGTCTVCSSEGGLSLGEARFHRNLLTRLVRSYCAPPSRFVTCMDCGWRWNVRADDVSAEALGFRAPAERVPPRADGGRDRVPTATGADRRAAGTEAADADRRAAGTEASDADRRAGRTDPADADRRAWATAEPTRNVLPRRGAGPVRDRDWTYARSTAGA